MYKKKYGLARRPFENTPDPHFLFLSKMHREVLSSLVYGIDSAKGFILVSGDIGTGKTTLIYALLRQIEPANIVLHIINPRTNFDEIIHQLSSELDIDPAQFNKPNLLNKIRDKLIQKDKKGKKAVLIIDEAHLLSENSLEDIRILSNIESEKRKLIQIVLVGQNEIHDLLNKASQRPLKQRIVFNRYLTAFNRANCFEFIQHRLKIAGATAPIFSQAALKKIWEKSQGVPRVINHICDNALLIGFALDKSVIGPKIIKEVISDMESGVPSIPAKKAVHKTHKILWATLAASILVFCIFYYLDPQLYSQTFSAVTTRAQPRQTEVYEYKIKPKPSRQPVTQVVQPEPDLIKKGMTTGVALAKEESPPQVPQQYEKLPFKPILNIENNHAQLIEKSSEQQRQVQPGDYILRIAKKEFNTDSDMMIDLIHMVNPKIKNINKIYKGQNISLPILKKEDLIVKNATGNYHIHYSSHYNYAEVQKTIDGLGTIEQTIFFLPVKQGDNLVYRIYIGVFKNREPAANHLKKLDFSHLPNLQD